MISPVFKELDSPHLFTLRWSPFESMGSRMGLFDLLKSKDIDISGQWISEKDMPGGVAFFTGPHTIPSKMIGERYGHDLAGFTQACLDLGGTPLNMADAAFSFTIVPSIPVAVLLWKGDEEFPAEARLLFDKTITEHMALDVIFGLAVEICSTLGLTETREK